MAPKPGFPFSHFEIADNGKHIIPDKAMAEPDK